MGVAVLSAVAVVGCRWWVVAAGTEVETPEVPHKSLIGVDRGLMPTPPLWWKHHIQSASQSSTETSHGLYYEANPVSAPPSQVNSTSSKREASSVLVYYKNIPFTGFLGCFLLLQLDEGFTSSPPRLAHGGKLR